MIPRRQTRRRTFPEGSGPASGRRNGRSFACGLNRSLSSLVPATSGSRRPPGPTQANRLRSVQHMNASYHSRQHFEDRSQKAQVSISLTQITTRQPTLPSFGASFTSGPYRTQRRVQVVSDFVKQHSPDHHLPCDRESVKSPRKLRENLVHYELDPRGLAVPRLVVRAERRTAPVLPGTTGSPSVGHCAFGKDYGGEPLVVRGGQ